MPPVNPVTFFLKSADPNESLLKEDSSKASFKRLAELAETKDIDLRFVLGDQAYENGVFNDYWKLSHDGTYAHLQEPFTPGMMYVKNMTKKLEQVRRVNNSFLEEVSQDKLLTAQTFPQLVKKTLPVIIGDLSQLNTLTTDIVVIKPRFGFNGTDVQILTKKEVTSELLINEAYVMQEFIDSSGGIPNLTNQRHEMRVYILNGKIHAAYLRLPATDSYLANIAQGATAQQIDNSQIPESFTSVIEEVDSTFLDVTPRLYTIDMMNEHGRPWIVELNNSPGLPDVAVQPLTDNYLSALLDLLVGRYR